MIPLVKPKMNAAKISKKPPATRDAEATKTQILDAALVEFAIGGLAAARMEAIAAQTGVTKAMIYYYFDSKENLYRTVMERCFREDLKLIEQLNLQELPPKDALISGLRMMFQSMAATPLMANIFTLEAIQNKGKYYPKESAQQLYGQLMCLLEAGMNSGVFRDMEPRHMAINIVGACIFYFVGLENIKHLWPGKKMLGKEMLAQHAQSALDMILAGILTEPYISGSVDANQQVF
jgi:TetR/AcrR family transcriptional regulator